MTRITGLAVFLSTLLACGKETPLDVCTRGESATDPDSCSVQWDECDSGTEYKVECNAGGVGAQCICFVDGDNVAVFESSDGCAVLPDAEEWDDIASLGCGWNLRYEPL